jgi:ribosome biogenesis protein Tsr3
MRDNQAGRRNVNAAWRIELELGNKADLIEIGKAKQAVTLKQNAKTVLSENDNTCTTTIILTP